jgi:hypothetical protein
MTMTKKTASELAAERLGYGLDPHDEVSGDVEELLSRDEWSDADRRAARATIARAKTIGPRPEPEKPEPERAKSASELAADRLSRQSERARRTSRGWDR